MCCFGGSQRQGAIRWPHLGNSQYPPLPLPLEWAIISWVQKKFLLSLPWLHLQLNKAQFPFLNLRSSEVL